MRGRSGTTDEAASNGWSPDRVTIPLLSGKEFCYYKPFCMNNEIASSLITLSLHSLLAKTI
ncbi:hypothetical protein KAS41_01685 [Candidatus Parcubacteria bacterium]|nr:hypothetical protein [Candidatus Parcubacteria bacterium]